MSIVSLRLCSLQSKIREQATRRSRTIHSPDVEIGGCSWIQN
jgi:hypothetical protein